MEDCLPSNKLGNGGQGLELKIAKWYVHYGSREIKRGLKFLSGN